ncbi:MAG: BspA family leucine-rich repeat surface protein [Candidatus Paceibacteria bacterium]
MNQIIKFLLLFCVLFGAEIALAAPIVPGSFSTTWDTGVDTTVTINLGVCPSAIYWEEIGNASNNGTTTDCVGSTQTITFPTPGQYRTDFSGSFTKIDLGVLGNRYKFRTVEQWGSSNWTDMYLAFSNVTQLVFNAVDTPDLSSVTDMSYMFSGATNFNSPIGNWDVSNVTSMFFMFRSAAAFNQPLNAWNISNVTNIKGIFNNATSFNQPLDNWDVSQITEMHSVFAGATAFNQPLNSWDVSQVTSFRGEAPYPDRGMFAGATSFNQPLDAWDVSSASDMRWMFNGATSFNQPLDAWDVSNVTSMASMFQNATAFNQPLDAWDVSNVTSMASMFQNATAFNQPLNSWDVSSASDMIWMFNGASSFNQSLRNWQIYSEVAIGDIFRDATALSSENYADMLIGWSQLSSIPMNIDLGIVSARYCDTAENARTLLRTEYLWNITDLGPEVCASVEEPAPEVTPRVGNGSTRTKVGLREKRLDDLKAAMSSSTAPVSEKLVSFVSSLKKFLNYLTTHEEEMKNLSPEESKAVIMVLRDAILELLKWLPGV